MYPAFVIICSIKSVFSKHNGMDIQINKETNAEEFRGIRRERKKEIFL